MAAIARREAVRRLGARGAPPVEEKVSERGALDAGLDLAPLRLDIRAALAELNAEDRRLLALRYEADLTQPALAELLAVPEGTVKVRLHRLRRKLLERLEET